MRTSDRTAVAEERDAHLDQELAGLDALELAGAGRGSLAARTWSAAWPKVAALAIGLLVWQAAVWADWRPRAVLPPPGPVWDALWEEASRGLLWSAIGNTMRRAALGFAMALALGVVLGGLVAQVRVLRTAVGSFITGLQTMPSIAWFPLAMLLFPNSETAIYFVVILGATPSIANGLIGGIDNLPPLYLRAGRTLGATGLTLFRYVTLPGALPTFVGGIKQGWAFAWRSLMAGELIVVIAQKQTIGFRLDVARQVADAPTIIAYMLVILAIGIALDALFFGAAERAIQRRWGLLGAEQG